jgi:eukaryotic-like serine/threonine-protein kinase
MRANPGDMQGTVLAARYLLVRELGSGGMGAVYEANDLRTGGRVAVKLLHPAVARDPVYAERLQREARIVASLTSPRVVRIIDFDTDAASGEAFLVQEFVDGETLASVLTSRGALAVTAALEIGREVARALEAAERAAIVHRDLKPSNIMLVDGQVKVLDFGIARAAADTSITRKGVYLGTPAYSAPEREEGRGDIRSDIYSLGVVLYEALAGAVPFDAPTPLSLLRLHALEPPPPLPDTVSPPVRALVMRCLEKDPARRYQTPAALLAALDATIRSVSARRGQPAPSASVGREVTGARDQGAGTVHGTVTTSFTPFPQAPGPLREREQEIPAVYKPLGRTTAKDTPQPATERLDTGRPGRRRGVMAIAGAVLAVAAAGGIAFVALSRNDNDMPEVATSTATVAAGVDPRDLYVALLRTPLAAYELPPRFTAEPWAAGEPSMTDREYSSIGSVSADVHGPGRLNDGGISYVVYQSAARARERFDLGYSMPGPNLAINGEFTTVGIPEPARGITATFLNEGHRYGTSFCITVVDNVEIRGISSFADDIRSGDNETACRLAAAGVAHVRRVQAGP